MTIIPSYNIQPCIENVVLFDFQFSQNGFVQTLVSAVLKIEENQMKLSIMEDNC